MLTRRNLLQWGAVTALCSALPRRSGAAAPKAKSAIMLYMEGGPSQMDTFDLKPGAPTGGPFKAISTSVAGIQISEHLPQLAALMKEMALVRSVTSKEGNHDRARYFMHTGHVPQGGVVHPGIGSVLYQHHGRSELPGYVALGGPGKDAGLLGAQWAPFPVRNLADTLKMVKKPEGLADERFQRRNVMWRAMEERFGAQHPNALVKGQRDVGEQALAMMNGPQVAAFDIGLESDAVRERYGDSEFQRGCLMARRLVEVGVPCVEVTLKGWDTHKENFPTVQKLSADLDRGMAALVGELKERGLLQDTLVTWMGDFGRTPKINGNGGRDHFPRASCAVLCGGGVKAGQVLGATDATGEEIVRRPVGVPDLFRTLHTLLGLNPDEEWIAPSGRPIKAVDGGAVIKELV